TRSHTSVLLGGSGQFSARQQRVFEKSLLFNELRQNKHYVKAVRPRRKKLHKDTKEILTVRHGGQNVRHREKKRSALRQQVVQVFQRRIGAGDVRRHD